MTEINTNIVINRNGVDLTLSPAVFGKRSSSFGKTYLFADITEELVKNGQAIGWFGAENVAELLTSSSKKEGQAIWLSNLNEDGTMDWDSFKSDWATFTAGRDTLSDINDELETLYAEQRAVVDEAPETMEGFKLMKAKTSELGVKITVLKKKGDAISAMAAARAAARIAKKERAAATPA